MGIPSAYIELYVRDLQNSIDIFSNLIGMVIVREETNFAELVHGSSRFLLNSQPNEEFDEDNPIHAHDPRQPRGAGIEIVIEVNHLEECYERLKTNNSVKLTGHIQARSWGRKDFRLTHPDGFYIRITD